MHYPNSCTMQSLEDIFSPMIRTKTTNTREQLTAHAQKHQRNVTAYNCQFCSYSTIVFVSASMCVHPSVRLYVHSCEPCLFALI